MVQAQSTLVLVDITATDEKHNPVHQLSANDFTVLEDGQPQPLKVFEEHVAGAPAAFPAGPKLAPGTFTNYSPAPARGALNILLFDKLNTPLTAQGYVRDQVLKYLKEAPPGTRIAIFALTTDLKMLQGFTSDPELLRSMVEGKKNSLNSSVLMNNAVDGDNPGDDDVAMDAASLAPDAATIMANLQQFEAEQQSFQWRLRVIYTLNALNDLARYMSNLPGRKNLIWFSGSFPINILPDGDLQNPFTIVDSASDEFRQTSDLLSRGQVAVYPIDARGLMVAPMYNASSSGSSMARNPRNFGNAEAKWSQKTNGEHDTMKEMAEETGGRAFVNTNGLTEAVQSAIESGSNYYTVAYSPANEKWDGGFRRIQVKIDKPGVTLAYRRGYYADDPNKPVHGVQAQGAQGQSGQAQNGQPAPPPYNAFHAAMIHGAPDPTQLIFVAAVRPTTADSETAPVEGNQLGKDVQGPFRRYTVVFAITPRQINFATGQDGAHHFGLEFVTLVYNPNGELVNQQANGVVASIPDAKFADTLKRDIIYRQQISVPAKGEYYFRMGMRDRNTDSVGALEIPIGAVAKLQPASAAAAPAGANAKPN
jgi:VWFA-related protein